MTDEGVPYRRSSRVLWRTVGDTVIIAAPDRSDFEVLAGPSATVWHLLEERRTALDLVDNLREMYEDRRERMAEDVGSLLGHLDGLGLVVRGMGG